MGGTLEPDETPCGGLTMILSLPAARAQAAPGSAGEQAAPGELIGGERGPVPG